MAFSNDDIQEIQRIIADYLDDNGAAIEDNDDVPVITPSDATMMTDNGYSLPMVHEDSGTYSYGKVVMKALVNYITGNVGTEGVLLSISYDDFNTIFGTSYQPSSS